MLSGVLKRRTVVAEAREGGDEDLPWRWVMPFVAGRGAAADPGGFKICERFIFENGGMWVQLSSLESARGGWGVGGAGAQERNDGRGVLGRRE